MRSIEDPPEQPSTAQRFGAHVRDLATRRGYDLRPGKGGQSRLIRDTGMSQSTVSRMLDGLTLPMPNQFEKIARALNVHVRELLIEAEVISASEWPEDATTVVRSATSRVPHALSPEQAADTWGITNPIIRRMLITNIEQAIRLQSEQNAAATGTL